MKKLITLVLCMSALNAHAFWNKPAPETTDLHEHCKDVLEALKKFEECGKDPVSCREVHQFAISLRQVADNPFTPKDEKADIKRKIDCLNTFLKYPQYMYNQRPLSAFIAAFKNAQKDKPELTKEAFSDAYFKSKDALLNENLKEDINFRLAERTWNFMASKEEKAEAREWQKTFESNAPAPVEQKANDDLIKKFLNKQ